MLQLMTNNCVQEVPHLTGGLDGSGSGLIGGSVQYYPNYQQFVPWMNYTVYYCTDKTKKAIEVLKHLQNKKILTCNSVNRFIELVEEISNLL